MQKFVTGSEFVSSRRRYSSSRSEICLCVHLFSYCRIQILQISFQNKHIAHKRTTANNIVDTLTSRSENRSQHSNTLPVPMPDSKSCKWQAGWIHCRWSAVYYDIRKLISSSTNHIQNKHITILLISNSGARTLGLEV